MKINIAIISLIALVLWALGYSMALAQFGGSFNIPSPSEVAEELERRYHLNLEELQSKGEMQNVSEQKMLTPEVSLFFSPTDPKPGEEITAIATPLFFQNDTEDLYYTWYIKRAGCDISQSSSREIRQRCDFNEDGRITVEDWKIEAMQIYASGEFDTSTADYSALSRDNDEYSAFFGGHARRQSPKYCYILDRNTGEVHELYRYAGDQIGVGLCDENRAFPNAPGDRTGDGVFGREEEEFWRTNPQDTDTANTGYGDEANVVGRGATQFTWNYQVGDEIGVIVEGTSLIPTKHADYSNMIMWALPNNDCSVIGKGAYEKIIKGYSVNILTADMNINDCIPDNLVDPREGGQQENLNVSLSYNPEDPINDSSEDSRGGLLSVQSSLSNSSRDSSGVLYEWTVFASSDGSYNPRGYSRDSGDDTTASWVNITEALVNNELLSRVQGNDLSSLRMRLAITDDVLAGTGLRVNRMFPESSGGVGYLRIRLTAKEQFSAGSVREGSSTVIIRVVNSDTKITALLAKLDESGKFVAGDTIICNDETTLQRGTCYVVRNEVIAVRLDNESADNFTWTLNGAPLSCASDVSNQCENAQQGNVAFFPITGKDGERYTVSVTAIDSETGQPISFSRTFEITSPFAEIIPTDTVAVWPKYLGYYIDTEGKRFNDISTEIFQTYSGNTANMRALFFPGFIGESSNTSVYWETNAVLEETGENATISFPILANPGSTYSITMKAVHRQSSEVRDAMRRIWNLSGNDTITHTFEKTVQIEVLEDLEYEDLVIDDPRAFFASLAMNAPSYLWLLIQSTLSIVVSIFVLGILYSLARSSRE